MNADQSGLLSESISVLFLSTPGRQRSQMPTPMRSLK